MRLLLIDPPFYRFMGYYTRYFPYGLAALAAHARTLGHEPFIYDADHDIRARGVDYQALPQRYSQYLKAVSEPRGPVWGELTSVLDSTRPQWVGITALTAKMAAVMQAARLVREALPDVPIVVGGPHGMVRPGEILVNAPEVDGVVVGEGEPVLEALLVEDRTSVGARHDVPGLVTRASLPLTEVPPADLDRLAAPARDCFLRGRYAREDLGLLMASRGCPFGCTYCFRGGLWRRRVRFVPLPILDEELANLHRAGVRHATFKDDVFTLDRDRTLSICRMLADRGMSWDCVTRADHLDEELLEVMRRHGCTGIKIGVETGSVRMMERLDRATSLDGIRAAATWLRRSKVHWTAYFMMGLPGESMEDLDRTYRFMRELRPDFASLSGYEAFPGTALFAQAQEQGIVKHSLARDEFFRISPHDYYFTRDDRGMILPRGLSYPSVESAMHARFHRYNASVPRLLKRVKSRTDVWRGEPLTMMHDAARLASWLRSRRGASR
jgi:radical SAM superfamily enzyme YgiQ (UPF0313 family)